MLFVTNLTGNSLTTQNSKMHALFRLYFLCYIRIYNLEVSFNFCLTFLHLNVIKNVHHTVKTGFSLTSNYLLRAPDNSDFF